jgi:hypothetical protein
MLALAIVEFKRRTLTVYGFSVAKEHLISVFAWVLVTVVLYSIHFVFLADTSYG